MAYLGSLKGPRESEIVEKLGADFFGITPRQLEEDILAFRDEERRSEVQPVHRDETGRLFIVLSTPGNNQHRFFLADHGYHLVGEVQVH